MASRDFLSGFGREARTPSSEDKAGGSEEIDKLRLGLSLGGCFGTGPTMPEAKKQCLPRSSSTAAVCTLPREDLATTAEPLPPLLHRTSSLPTEHDEARFQRKAMQCQRRLAAKRKRLERRVGLDLLRVGLDPAASDQETQKLARSDSEHTLVRIQLGTG
jgi:hypothetical protein